jgi:TonB family protein
MRLIIGLVVVAWLSAGLGQSQAATQSSGSADGAPLVIPLTGARPPQPPVVSMGTRPPAPYVISNPDWVRVPTGNDFATLYPKAAARQGISGHVTMACGVLASGVLTDCKVASETPPGWLFGDTALRLASLMKMRPLTRDGVPVAGAKVIIPISFRVPQPAETPAPAPSDQGMPPPSAAR